MSQPQTCVTCHMAREICPDCAGQICSEECPDQTCVCTIEREPVEE